MIEKGPETGGEVRPTEALTTSAPSLAVSRTPRSHAVDAWPTNRPWTRHDPTRYPESAARPPAPSLTQEDSRPVAGYLLDAKGNTLRVVRYGPEPVPFGFQGSGA